MKKKKISEKPFMGMFINL